MKRAAIYLRTSTERQAEQVSPITQEADCRAYCEAHGYYVVDVYRDIEKYRVGKRMVEPSGTRSDRPQLKRILADVDAGVFDVLIAWREDRLYRGINAAVLWISDRVKNKKMEVELVKEFYDPKTAAVKAWAAGVELDAKHDRIVMGFRGRLQKGLPLNNPIPYGYDRLEDGRFVINETEAEAVHMVFEMFAKGETIGNIRQQLIGMGFQPKKKSKYPFQTVFLYNMLKAKRYSDGFVSYHWDGDIYDVPVPVLIEPELAELVKARFDRYHRYPAGNLRERALGAGLVYCAPCNLKMFLENGSSIPLYRCSAISNRRTSPHDCCQTKSMAALDKELWAKLWNLISEPGKFEGALESRIAELQAEEVDAGAAVESLERRLAEMSMERNQVIAWARKKIITEEDLEIQLDILEREARDLNNQLSEKRLLIGNRAEKLIALARDTRELAVDGWEAINGTPEDEDQAQLQFEFKKKLIQGIVNRVDVHPDKSITVFTEFNFGKDISISSASYLYTDTARSFRVSLTI